MLDTIFYNVFKINVLAHKIPFGVNYGAQMNCIFLSQPGRVHIISLLSQVHLLFPSEPGASCSLQRQVAPGTKLDLERGGLCSWLQVAPETQLYLDESVAPSGARKFWGFTSDPGSGFHFKIYIFESQNIVWRRLRRLELPDAPYFPFRARYTLFPLQSQEHQIFLHLEPGTQTTPRVGSNFNPQNFWDWRPMIQHTF